MSSVFFQLLTTGEDQFNGWCFSILWRGFSIAVFAKFPMSSYPFVQVVICCPTWLVLFQCCIEQLHVRAHTNEHRNCDQFLKIRTTNRWQIKPDGAQISKQSRFWGVLWLCGGWLVAQRTKGQPRCTLGCENHVSASPSWDGFWYNLSCFVALCFVVFSTLYPKRYLIDLIFFWAHFQTHVVRFLEELEIYVFSMSM